MTVRPEMKHGKRRWVIDILYRLPDGTPDRYRRYAQVQTRAAANAEERRLLARLVQTGTLRDSAPERDPEPSPSYTFDEAVSNFRRTKARKKLKPSTRRSYDAVIDSMLLPRFSERLLEGVWWDDADELDIELVEAGASESYRRNIQCVLRSVLRNAVDRGMLDKIPELPKLPKVPRTVPKSMMHDDFVTLFEAASPTGQLAMALAYYAGLRASEVRGLRWTDIDLKAVELTVRRGLCDGQEAPPKSHAQRPIPIAAPLLAILKMWKEKRKAELKKSPWAPVAVTRYGRVWGDSGLGQMFERAQQRAELEGWSFHSLRHGFTSQLFRRGASAPVVQRLLGHAELTTTQIYCDLVATDLRAAIDLFGSGDTVETT